MAPCDQHILELRLFSTDISTESVKAAGVLCVLGISFGIGTYVLYKIYDRFFRPSCPRKPSLSDCEDYEEEVENVCYHLQTDESGTMGNQQSSLADIPVYYKPGYGVSLYKPPTSDTSQLRNRKNGLSSTGDEVTPVLKGNPPNKNGMVPKDGLWLNTEVWKSGKAIDPEHQAPELSELRIDVDESGFVEDDGFDPNNDKLSNSLKGNFSPTSLFEKNCFLSEKGDLETDGNDLNGNLNGFHNSVGDKANAEISNKPAPKDHLNLVAKLGASSVLLTPPSEDELSSSSQKYFSGSAPFSQHSTKSDVSDIHSEVIDPVIPEHNMPETDEDQDQMSPLPYDKSPHRTPERHFKKKLMLKLGEISAKGITRSHGSTNSSCSSTPDSYLGHRRTDSSGGDKENSISGISSPELELLHSENSDCPLVVPETFEHLEDEIHVVEDEFETISQKLHELTSKYSNQVPEPGADIFQSIFQRYPSIRVRQAEHGIRYRLSSLSENDSTQESKDTSQADDADLSWDLENVLDMVYSEASDSSSMQNNPLVEKLNCADKKSDSHDVTMEVILENGSGSGSFNSTVELEGSLYEDDFHLELAGSSQKADKLDRESGNTKDKPNTSQLAPSTTVCNVGNRLSIVSYADSEWKGETAKADLMKKAYREIPRHCKCCHLQRIRGDNYCGVRGAVFQILVNCLPPNHIWASKDAALLNLSCAYNDPATGLGLWTFAGRIPYTSDNQLDIMSRCISAVYNKFDQLKDQPNYNDRVDFVTRMLNSDPNCDLDLMEGVKLLMLLSAIRLHNDMQQGNDVPVFAWLMFARDTSEDLPSFVKNHLNPVGNAGGLEQVEMFLLGYSLGVRIQVFRLQQYGQEDFISYYPDDCKEGWSSISLIAEDDRHYNVPVK